jgi:2-(1,2-epoxy-1,2-dihydrophenyl)acetyl-CoA isomerase
MAAESLRIERDGALARLVLGRPHVGNPIDGNFCAQWTEAAIDLSCDSGVRAILMIAEGKNFSVGGDIGVFQKNLADLSRLIKRWAGDFHSGISRLQRADAPLVTAVQGICAGGGVSLAAGADYLLASDDAQFVSAYVGLGFCVDGGGTVMLSRRMGQARAKRFMMMRETLNAQQALAAGLVDEVVPAERLAKRADEVTRRLAAGPTRAYGELKRLFVTVEDNALDTQMELEGLALARCAGTADAREAITAFAEKRKPVFEGR